MAPKLLTLWRDSLAATKRRARVPCPVRDSAEAPDGFSPSLGHLSIEPSKQILDPTLTDVSGIPEQPGWSRVVRCRLKMSPHISLQIAHPAPTLRPLAHLSH